MDDCMLTQQIQFFVHYLSTITSILSLPLPLSSRIKRAQVRRKIETIQKEEKPLTNKWEYKKKKNINLNVEKGNFKILTLVYTKED